MTVQFTLVKFCNHHVDRQMLLWVKLVCKNLTQTHTDKLTYNLYLACWSYSLIKCIDTQHRCSRELLHSHGFISQSKTRGAAPLLPCLPRMREEQHDSTTDNNIEPIIIIYTIYMDSKVMPRYISDIQMYSKCSRCF